MKAALLLGLLPALAEEDARRRVSVTPADYTVATYAGAGSSGAVDNADPLVATFSGPNRVVVDNSENVYVVDAGNYVIRMIAADGTVTTLAGSGSTGYNDATGTAAQFAAMGGIALNTAQTELYVSDTGNDRIRKIVISSGVVTTFAGSGVAGDTDHATGTTAQFHTPQELAMDSSDNIYLADSGNHLIRKITSAGVVTTLAGNSGTTGTTDGTGTAAEFNTPTGICMDGAGNIYVADKTNHLMRKVTSLGVVTTVAGDGATGTSDGIGTAAEFSSPQSCTVDPWGIVNIADTGNNVVRLFDPVDNSVDTLAFDGTAAHTDGTGAAAQCDTPTGVASKPGTSFILYVVETTTHQIRKITGPATGTQLAYYLGGGATTLDLTDVSQYPNTGNYYKDRVANNTAVNINRGLHPDYYLGHISCPGRSVCKDNWIGNGYCDDCFGCDQYMVATGFYGDCSTCDYFWSGGVVGQGEFDGGDCGDFVFPNAVNEAFLDQCLNDTGIRTYTDLAGMQYAQKRNTIILELNAGGWGDITTLQSDTDVTLSAKCEYLNIKQCLIKNGWYLSTMSSDTDGDLTYTATSYIDDLTTYSSHQLTQMNALDLLEQCVLAGLTQAMLHHGWTTVAESTLMTSDEKRNRAISSLSSLGFGTISQLQTLHNSQLRFLMDHMGSSGLAPDEHAW